MGHPGRHPLLITHEGITLPARTWAAWQRIPYMTVYNRHTHLGWSWAEALEFVQRIPARQGNTIAHHPVTKERQSCILWCPVHECALGRTYHRNKARWYGLTRQTVSRIEHMAQAGRSPELVFHTVHCSQCLAQENAA